LEDTVTEEAMKDELKEESKEQVKEEAEAKEVKEESQAEEEPESLDPLAVWCGEVSLMPKAAFDEVGLGSSFASAGKLLSPAACVKARDAWSCWQEEFRALSTIEDSRVMAADLRVQANNQILLADTVWLSRKTWNRFSKLVAKGTSKFARWKLFLEEASAVRWGIHKGDEKDDEADHHELPEGGQSLDSGKSVDESAASAQASPSGVRELLLYEGILCDHGKVSKPKAGFLVPRGMLEEVLRCTKKKEQAYKALWGSCRGTRRFRMGHREQRLVASDEVCEMCCSEWAAYCANPNRHCRSGIETCMLLLDNGGPAATPHTLEVPWEDGRTMTGSWLREIVAKQVSSEIVGLYVGGGKGEQRLLRDDDVMDLLPATLRAHVRSETTSEPEGDAFLRSVFLLGRR